MTCSSTSHYRFAEESWEDSIDVEPTVTATMAMCIECCDHFDVALGAFVILCGPKDESSAVD